MSYSTIVFHSNGVFVVDGALAAERALQWAAGGEGAAFVLRTADDVVPAVEYVKNLDDLSRYATNVSSGNFNEEVKETFASLLGMMAAIASVGRGPAAALAADQFMSNAFKYAYDGAQAWSSRQDWTPLFDAIDDVKSNWNDIGNVEDFGGDPFTGMPWPGVDPRTSTAFRTALTPPSPRDPLAIDLDGDGIETVGISTDGTTPILFDHNADGIKTGTGWVRGDDAWLVLDRNANGTIDSGQELFGVDTLIPNANGTVRTARDGFEALRTLDANADGLFNASDAGFSQVRLWQDANQDGISQSSELFTLASRNIASIALTPSGSAVNLGNGNTLTGQATVTRTNGTTTQIDSVAVTAPGSEGASNLELASNPFYREFTTPVTLSTTARGLPEMGGSGVVRDLREAMSLGTAQSTALVSAVQAFATGSNRSAQRASLNELLRNGFLVKAAAIRMSEIRKPSSAALNNAYEVAQ